MKRDFIYRLMQWHYMGDFGHMKQGCSGALLCLSAFYSGNETNRQIDFQVDKTFVPPATGTLHWRCLVFCGVVKGVGGGVHMDIPS